MYLYTRASTCARSCSRVMEFVQIANVRRAAAKAARSAGLGWRARCTRTHNPRIIRGHVLRVRARTHMFTLHIKHAALAWR